ncbi:hypothetical protein K9M42_01280 [Patescibacteria group bacterium]|nr:hypothetical protein [Patescibacteria group bacterium]
MTRKKIIIISLIFLLLSAFFVFLIYLLDKQNPDYNLLNNNDKNIEEKEEVAPSYDIVISDQEKITSLSRGFIQTLKTYNNKTNFSNIVDMYPLMTDSFKSKMISTLEGYLENSEPSSDFFTQKIHVRDVNLILFNEGDTVANVEVFCDKYSGDDPSNLNLEEVKYILDLVKIGSEWKVDNIY